MIRYDIRFWDKEKQQLIYGAGLSPNQKPIVQNPDGSLVELKGNFIPMINTGQRAVNGTIWEGDVCECDIPFMVEDGVVLSWTKARVIMQYNQGKGAFTLNIVATPEMEGKEFVVSNSRIIGCAISNPELLNINPNQNDSTKNTSSASAETKVDGNSKTS